MQASPKDTVCNGTSKKIFAVGASNYKWFPETGLSSSTVAAPYASPAATTMYRVIGTDNYGCFADTAHVTVVVGHPTQISIGRDTALLAPTLYTFNPATSANDIVNWRWKVSGQNTYSCLNCAAPQAKIVYDECVSCTATNIYGCQSSDTICIKTFCPTAEIFVPNAFTPDNDGINDILVVQGKGIKMIKSFRIFNRWGELVFERTNFLPGDKNNAWDGTIRSKAASPDVFVYVCEVICEKGYPTIFKGNVAILK
jgi:gliding motility-associated-like protein